MPWKVFRYTGKNTPTASRNSLAVSSMPNHRITSGINASAGMLRTICSVVSSSVSARRTLPVNRPSSSPAPAPIAKPLAARHRLVRRCSHNSPETAKVQKALATAHGSGRMRLDSQPSCDAACQLAISRTGSIHGAKALGRGAVVLMSRRLLRHDITGHHFAERTAQRLLAGRLALAQQREHQLGEAVRFLQVRIAGEDEGVDAQRRIFLDARIHRLGIADQR